MNRSHTPQLKGLALFAALAIGATPSSAQLIAGTEYANQPALAAINLMPAYNAGLSGAGVRVGVVDSGINPDHVEFSNAIVAGYDAITGLSGNSNFSSFLTDSVGHGSHVASIAAGRLDGDLRPSNMQGVAYKAGLVIGAMNFFPDLGVTDRTIASALDYVSNQSARVINISWEWGSGTVDPLANYQDFGRTAPLINTALKTALARGSVLVIAAGNDGAANPGSPAILPSYDAEIAAKGGLIVVAATSIDGTSLAYYSNRCGISKDYCIAAPGGGITDPGPPSAQFILGADGQTGAGNADYVYMAGTSMAAPLVSGAVAIVAEQFPWMSNKNLATTILTTGSRASAPDVEWGRGLLDVGKAIKGPALFEEDFEANVPSGYASVFANDIGYRAGLNGGLTKQGAGTLVLSGVDTYVGATQINGGTLVVNGSLASPVTVGVGGTLRGTGSLSGALSVNGTLAPGNSPGTLIASNTVTMNAGSLYRLDIDGTATGNGVGSYSRLWITGGNNQFIANGTMQPVLRNISASATNSFTPALGDSFRVVSAEGGVSGRFSTLTQPAGLASGTRFAAFYDVFSSHSIDLKVLPSSYVQWLGAGNTNTRAAAGALDQILGSDQAGNASTVQSQLLYLAAGKRASELPGFTRSLSGEIHGALAAAQPLPGQWLEASVGRRLSLSQASRPAAADQNEDAVARHALWLDMGSSQGRRKADRNASGFTSTNTQWAVGGDLLADGPSRLGAGLSYADVHVAADPGSATLSATSGFVYAQHMLADLLIDGLASAGLSDGETTRPDPTGLTRSLKSSVKSQNTLLSIGVRQPWASENLIIEPFARLTWQRTSRSGADEGAAVAALSFSGDVASGVRTLLGVSGGSLKQDPWSVANTYRFRLGVGYDAGDLSRPELAASLAGIGTTVTASRTGRPFLQASAFFTAPLGEWAYGYLGLNSEVRKGLCDIGVNVGAVVAF